MIGEHGERPAGYVSRLESGPYARTDVAADVSIDEGTVVVRADLPGYDESAIEVELVDRGLRIEAQPGEARETEGRVVRRERGSGPVVRTVELPSDVDPAGASARYERGVLTVEIPRGSSDGEVDGAGGHVVAIE